jgi:hypothetical protein
MKTDVENEANAASEPKMNWQRVDFDLKLLEGKNWRERAEIETNRDLQKPIEQLLCDFHDMAELVIANASEQEKATISWYMINAQKRMVGMMAKVALSNDQLSRRVYWLTITTVGICVLQLVVALIQTIIALCQS